MTIKPITIRYLSGHDVAELALDNDEILDAIESSLRAQGNGETVIEPRMHLRPNQAVDGHFNVLRGYIAPHNTAGIKIVGDFHNNYQQGLPSEFGLLESVRRQHRSAARGAGCHRHYRNAHGRDNRHRC